MSEKNEDKRYVFILIICAIIVISLPIFLYYEKEKRIKSIFLLVEHDDFKTVKAFLKQDPGLVNFKNKDSCLTPIYFAKSGAMADLLIENGADINFRDINNYTPLHLLIGLSSKEAAKILILKGADVNAKDNDSDTPLKLAERMNFDDIADLLRKHGAKE